VGGGGEPSVWVSSLATRLPQTRHLWFFIPWASDRSKSYLCFSQERVKKSNRKIVRLHRYFPAWFHSAHEQVT
jgi:hypothetical protein